MRNTQKCPICNSENALTVFSLEEYPYITVPVKKQDKKEILAQFSDKELKNRLEPVICGKCSHIYLKRPPAARVISELYSRHYSYPSALEGSFSPERDIAFLKLFGKQIRKLLKKDQNEVLEIGCYDGYILHHLKKRGFNVLGCDPSKGADIGKKYGINIVKKFFNAKDFKKQGSGFDVIIFRHMLEHMSKPVSFLKNLKGILNSKGLIIFEVPNIEFCLKNKNTSVFSFQHLQYFSEESIHMLLKRSGFKLAKLINLGENLIAVCSPGKFVKYKKKRSVSKLCYSFMTDLKVKTLQINNVLRRLMDKGIVLWGAGTFCRNVIAAYKIPNEKIKCIVDSDPNKWDMEYIEYDIPIRSPEALKMTDHDGLMVCSMYTRQIINRLRILRYNKPLIKFHPSIAVINSKGKRSLQWQKK